MHAIVRTYAGPGARDLFGLLERRKSEVEGVLKGVSGLVSYTMARTQEGGITVTVCQDKAGTEQSSKLAREWIQKNAADISSGIPAISEGAVILQLK